MTMATDYTNWKTLVDHMVPAEYRGLVNWDRLEALVRLNRVPATELPDVINSVILLIWENETDIGDVVNEAMKPFYTNWNRRRKQVNYNVAEDGREDRKDRLNEMIGEIRESLGDRYSWLADQLAAGMTWAEIGQAHGIGQSTIARMIGEIKPILANYAA